MHTKTEYLIWDKIVNSAKNRIDLASYGERASKISPEVMDKFILHIIAAFASGEDHCSISTNLHNELHHIGIDVQEDVIDKIIEDKHVVFSAEIYAAYLTFSMLEDGYSEQEVLGYISDLLDSPKIH
ncbi:hypothetical protein BC792_103163 [Sphingobacterium allocomposti]|jgi:hypothetical protein|uniref:Uncharacterized protein n=1 Tax=Sphingobacterium allocomposti TaxID=415956 RepID=A0A5S5DMU4_9SPHI|nr:hypothetical protein [Sphingobacterium composti Yoo et al. 2007 non Ten et al. 2007]TYP97237.1 hypothetical protein BC792_103163 [Sphingobacterium composti Yoo et al. 2007 non Ten et al. 2007]HLS95060.1 hypothetical protein [Sphingobacterium sp.]